MAERLLKKKAHKVTPKKSQVKESTDAVIVGKYKAKQLAWIKRHGIYNYPVREEDLATKNTKDAKNSTCTTLNLQHVKELWLYADMKGTRHVFEAEFVGMMTRKEFLSVNPTYAKLGPSKNKAYYVFKTKFQEYGSRLENPIVVARTADFGRRSAKVKKAIEQFKADGEFAPLAVYLPSDLAKISATKLSIGDAAVQCELFNLLMPESIMRYARAELGSYRVASLFAGCGGLDLGFIGGFDFLGKKFRRNKFDIVWANELNPNACKTYVRNLGSHVVCGDIKEKIDEIPTGVDVIIGGFPCQDISINGKMKGIKGKRSSLYSYIVEAVKRCRPKVFLAENVGSLMLKQHEHSFKTILADFESLDYNVTYKVYHAEEYGVPQTRERVIFVGTRKDVPLFTPPAPLSGNPITCGEALHDLEKMPVDKAFSHIWSEAAPSGEQGSRRMIENRPGYTIRAECHGNIQFHYKLARRLSMREAARIQSFPDTFVFPCGIRETERQIGNAVPPVLAWYIAREIQKVLEGSK